MKKQITQPEINLTQLVERGYAIHQQLNLLNEEFKQIKDRLKAEGLARPGEHVPLTSGNSRNTPEIPRNDSFHSGKSPRKIGGLENSIMIETTLPETCHQCKKAPIENTWPFVFCRSCNEDMAKKAMAVIEDLLNCPDPKIRASTLRLIEKMKPKTTVTVVYRKKRKAPVKSIL